jgi:hypothetical protein
MIPTQQDSRSEHDCCAYDCLQKFIEEHARRCRHSLRGVVGEPAARVRLSISCRECGVAERLMFDLEGCATLNEPCADSLEGYRKWLRDCLEMDFEDVEWDEVEGDYMFPRSFSELLSLGRIW